MQIAGDIISAMLANSEITVVTSMLIVFGIEKTGGDPGAPIIMRVSLLCICGIRQLLRLRQQWELRSLNITKSFRQNRRVLIFLFTVFPFTGIEVAIIFRWADRRYSQPLQQF